MLEAFRQSLGCNVLKELTGLNIGQVFPVPVCNFTLFIVPLPIFRSTYRNGQKGERKRGDVVSAMPSISPARYFLPSGVDRHAPQTVSFQEAMSN